jgi:hypothetical protein
MRDIGYNPSTGAIAYNPVTEKVQMVLVPPCSFCGDNETPRSITVTIAGVDACPLYEGLYSIGSPDGIYSLQQTANPCVWSGIFDTPSDMAIWWYDAETDRGCIYHITYLFIRITRTTNGVILEVFGYGYSENRQGNPPIPYNCAIIFGPDGAYYTAFCGSTTIVSGCIPSGTIMNNTIVCSGGVYCNKPAYWAGGTAILS